MTQRIRTKPTYSADHQLNRIIEEEAENGFVLDDVEIEDRKYILYFKQETEEEDTSQTSFRDLDENILAEGASTVLNTPDTDPRDKEDIEEQMSREILKAFGFDEKAVNEIIEEEFSDLE